MRVLAIAAHPDDIEIECGGTLIKCVKRGDEVYACHVSDGDLGHVIIEPEELGKIRRQEAQNAGKVGGYHVLYGGQHDLDIYAENKAARDKLVEIIRTVRPDFIIIPNPEDYMSDHTAVSKLAFDASFAATVPHYPCAVKEATSTVPIYYMESSGGLGFVPSEYVDISEEMEIKKQTFACHESQIVWLRDHDNVEYMDKIIVTNRYRGYQCGVTYAEGFRQCLVDHKVVPKRLLP